MPRFNRSILLTCGAVALTVLYVWGASISYRNDRDRRSIGRSKHASKLAEKAMRHPALYDSSFFRALAQKLAYRNEQKHVLTLLKYAMIKGPADFNNFLTAAQYASSSICCVGQAPAFFTEAVRRKPGNYDIHMTAASSLLKIGNKQQALAFFRRALLLNGSASHGAYQIVLKQGGSIQDLIALTPGKSESLVRLFSFLSTKRNISREEMKTVMDELDRIQMTPAERITVASAALQTNDLEWARLQAGKALDHPATRIDAMRILLELAEKEEDWKKFDGLTKDIEQAYNAMGATEEAASTALEAAFVRSENDSVEEKAQRFQEISQRYPDHASTYIALAELYERDNPQMAITYLQQALHISPNRYDYNSRLAKQYLEMSRFVDAEEIYKKFLHIPKYQITSYLGLAQCKQKANKPMEAVAVLKRALKRNEESVLLLRELAKVYESMEDYQQAAQTYEEVAILNPGKPGNHLQIAQTYERAGDSVRAEKNYRLVLKLSPGNKQARKALSQLSTSTPAQE